MNNHILKFNLTRMISDAKKDGEAVFSKRRELELDLRKTLDPDTYAKVMEYVHADRELDRLLDKWYRLTKELQEIKEAELKPFWKKLFKK